MKRMTLAAARHRCGFTQDELAERSGVDQTTISSLETGRKRSPRFDTVMKLSSALGVSPEQLCFGAVPEALAS